MPKIAAGCDRAEASKRGDPHVSEGETGEWLSELRLKIERVAKEKLGRCFGTLEDGSLSMVFEGLLPPCKVNKRKNMLGLMAPFH